VAHADVADAVFVSSAILSSLDPAAAVIPAEPRASGARAGIQ